jgi:hypothetical protein
MVLIQVGRKRAIAGNIIFIYHSVYLCSLEVDVKNKTVARPCKQANKHHSVVNRYLRYHNDQNQLVLGCATSCQLTQSVPTLKVTLINDSKRGDGGHLI